MSVSSEIPLTFQQKWLWDVIFANQSWRCTSTRAFRMLGPLNETILEACLQEVCLRHGALRTHIVATGGCLRQVTLGQEEHGLDRITITGTSDAEITENAGRCFEEVCDRNINPSMEPLWNSRLLKLSEHEHWLVLAMHRLIGDCVEIERIYREIKPLYSTRLHDHPSPLKLPAQYSNYAVWQQQTSSDWLKRHGPYWSRHLDGATPIQWPIDDQLSVGDRKSVV